MVSYESLKSEYERNWADLEIRPARLNEANAIARKAINGKATYQRIERLTGVPWYFVALCHYRESNFDFNTYLGNGETLHHVTTLVPKGRGPFASFVDGAVDALRIQNFIGTKDWSIARTLYRLECFDGLAYHAKGVSSPYLYGGSTLYGPPEARAGKFIRDHVFDPDHVDSQLGTAVILRAMMSLDSSIALDGSPQFAGRAEPEDEAASTVVLLQQSLNRLGAEPRLEEDGIVGPLTKAAVAQFQQQHGITESGVLDIVTTAAILRAAQQTTAPAPDLAPILKRLEDLAMLFRPNAVEFAASNGSMAANNGTPAASDSTQLERLLALLNKTAPAPETATPIVPASAPIDQSRQLIDLLSLLLANDRKPALGQVNGALGETIGKLLDGRKTALGIGGGLITALLSAVTATPNSGGPAGLLGTIANSVPGLSHFAMPIWLALTVWGVLGKMEKWLQGTVAAIEGLPRHTEYISVPASISRGAATARGPLPELTGPPRATAPTAASVDQLMQVFQLLSTLNKNDKAVLGQITRRASSRLDDDTAKLRAVRQPWIKSVVDVFRASKSSQRKPTEAAFYPKRSLNAWISDPSPRVHETFRVSINIGDAKDAAASIGLIEPTWGSATSMTLAIFVSCPDCNVEPSGQRLILPRTGDTERIHFEITATIPGDHEFTVRVYLAKQMIPLQSLRFVVKVKDALKQIKVAGS